VFVECDNLASTTDGNGRKEQSIKKQNNTSATHENKRGMSGSMRSAQGSTRKRALPECEPSESKQEMLETLTERKGNSMRRL
jgi:hypothetical protein